MISPYFHVHNHWALLKNHLIIKTAYYNFTFLFSESQQIIYNDMKVLQ